MDYLRAVVACGVAHFTATRGTADFDEELVEFLHADCDDMGTILGEYSHAEGYYTEASAQAAHAEGHYTEASGKYSHAEGVYTNAKLDGAHAEGGWTKAEQGYSHAEGYHTRAY